MNYALFRKPSRYIGNEINCIKKEGIVKVALCFPDTYEIGMSHIGLKILYHIINNLPDTSAERVYAPWVDYESYLREHHLPLTSQEFSRPLKEFDILGFTLQYELSYTNILNMLDLGGIPIRSENRDDSHPLVIAGGPCAVNPLPLAPFMDAFVIGDGEEVIQEILSAVRDQGSEVGDKTEVLRTLSQIEGVYVPVLHDSSRQKIHRRFMENLDEALYPDKPIVPYMQAVHDRIAIEIARGCTRGCRFCQAGMTYRPLRERSVKTVLSLAKKSLASTGYEEVSFTSLSAGDYSCLLPLLKGFNNMCAGTHTSISLPSLRVGSIDSEVLKEIKTIRKTGFTIAPEAGTKRLRDVINKDITDEEFDETLRKLFQEGWKKVKLYFMVGLPTETRADIEGLIKMALRARQIGKRITGRQVDVNAGISAFVPKPHTPFQWEGQNDMSLLREKQDHIKQAFRKKRIKFKGQHVENSLMEAVFSRGDRECAQLLENAWKLGCRFDGWSEHFDFRTWKAAAEKTGMDLFAYASRPLDPEKDLPWDFIDTGITKNFLLKEYSKAVKENITPDCRVSCYGCGLNCRNTEHRSRNTEDRTQTTDNRPLTPGKKPINVPSRIRIKFSKTGDMQYLSHQELVTSFYRALRRAHIPLAYSEGFHPHPKLSFGPALAVGIESTSEYADIELPVVADALNIMERLNNALPAGLRVLSATLIPLREKSLNEFVRHYRYEVAIDGEDTFVDTFMQQQECAVHRNNKTVNIRPMVTEARQEGSSLILLLQDVEDVKPRPHEILKELLGKSAEEIQTVPMKRTGLYGNNGVKLVEPITKDNHGR
jgi:radical SAM family uncharacterized protein/radical SAM-linked protein